jgi:hypothetical protein
MLSPLRASPFNTGKPTKAESAWSAQRQTIIARMGRLRMGPSMQASVMASAGQTAISPVESVVFSARRVNPKVATQMNGIKTTSRSESGSIFVRLIIRRSKAFDRKLTNQDLRYI